MINYFEKKHFLVLGRDSCPYCQATKETLHGYNLSYAYQDLTDDPTFLAEAKQFYNWGTVPIILMLDKETGESEFIGGHSDLLDTLSDCE